MRKHKGNEQRQHDRKYQICPVPLPSGKANAAS
jgi:hypothetical protein